MSRTARRTGNANPNMLASLPPVPGTSYWPCPNAHCRTPAGSPSYWPLRVRKPNGHTSKTVACPRCFAHRPLTDAEQQLIAGNPDRGITGVLPLALSLVQKFNNVWRGLDLEEAKSVAYESLTHAAGTFDPANGYRFSTHATVHVWGRLKSHFERVHRLHHGHAVFLASDTEQLGDHRLWQVMTASDDHAVDRHDNTATVAVLLESPLLTPDERSVLTLRYGLDGRGPRQFSEIAEHHGVTRQRCQQIEVRALAKLRERYALS